MSAKTGQSAKTPLLELAGLRAGYGRASVVDVDLTVHEGEIVALLGANGAGKTTTLRAVSGTADVFAGTVRFAGKDITGWRPERIAAAGLAYVPAERGLFRSLTVADTLRLATVVVGVSGAEARRRIDEVEQLFRPLAERREQPVGMLSGGEQQMLALACALVRSPRLLMVDEMSQGLAPTVVQSLLAVIADLPARGSAVLLVEQFVGQALAVADRAYVLTKGRVSHTGPAAALADDETFIRRSYLGRARPTRRQPTRQAAAPRWLRDVARRTGRSVDDLIREATEATEATETTKATEVRS